jgi:predicted phosphodiesterase
VNEHLTFFVCSDVHITMDGALSYDASLSNGVTNLRAWIDKANSNADASIVVGDLSHESDDMMLLASGMIKNLDNRIIAIGNHDVGYYQTVEQHDLRKRMAVMLYGLTGSYYSMDIDFCHVVVLDTCYDSRDNPEASFQGFIPDAEMLWLKCDIKSTKQPAVLVVMHHAPIEGLANCDYSGQPYFNPEDLSELQTIFESRNSVYVVYGHLHHPSVECGNLGTIPIFHIPTLTSGCYAVLNLYNPTNSPVEIAVECKCIEQYGVK